MDSVPPLNLSTSVKVEDSIKASANFSELENLSTGNEDQDNGERNLVLFHDSTQNSGEFLTITGEAVKENNDEELIENGDEDEKKDSTVVFVEGLDESSFKCSHCPITFEKAYHLRIHEKLHSEQKVCSYFNLFI